MFKAADNCGSDTMSVLVVGAGYIGMECAKAAMWCGVMDSHKFEINIIDKIDREKDFDSEFAYFENNASRVDKSIKYRFHQTDVNEPRFTRILENCGDVNYIIIGGGDDELTINTYEKIKQFYLRKAVENDCYGTEKTPVIIPVIRGKTYYEMFEGNTSDKLYPVGCNTEVFK